MNKDDHYKKLSKAPLLENTGITEEVARLIIDPLQDKGYPTQFTAINDAIGGLKQASFMVLGAEQGRGKSLLALNLILEQCRNDIKSCYIDIENGEPQTWKRLLMINYQLDSVSIMQSSVEEIKQMADDIKNLSYYNEKHLYALLEKEQVIKDVTLKLIKERASDGYKLFVLDPFSRFCEDDPRNELHEEGTFAGQLADLAREKNICIIAVHHLRKGGKNKRVKDESELEDDTDYAVPTLEGFRGSSKIIDRATEVIGLVRFPKQIGGDTVHIRILKSRTGKTGDVLLDFDSKTLTFTERERTNLEKAFGSSIKPIVDK